MATGVSLISSSPDPKGHEKTILVRVAAGFVRPRTISSSVSLEHRLGNFDLGVEFNWEEGKHLLGWRRAPTSSGWTDWLDSARDQNRSELRGRLRYVWKGLNLVVNYEFAHSRDNTDGPFSYTERSDNLRGEWARTTGIPVHNFTLVGNVNLPKSFSLTVLGSAHSQSPYNILTGKDVNNDGLFNDRGGLSRNSGNGPSYSTVSLYCSRHINISRIFDGKEKTLGADVGIQIENFLGRHNYLMLEPVS